MQTTAPSPIRLYLFELAFDEAQGVPTPGYLVQTSDGINILIDTGWPQEMIGSYKKSDKAGIRMDEENFVVHQLATLGLAPRDIHMLICTHLDPDHSGNHNAFPHAEFIVQEEQYKTAIASNAHRFLVNRQRWNHPDLRYRFVNGDTELLPGLNLIETSGHVPGHQSVLVRLPETGPILLAIDAITSTAYLDPERRALTPFDMNEKGVRASTRKLVELAQSEQAALIVHGHDPVQWKTLKKAPEYYS